MRSLACCHPKNQFTVVTEDANNFCCSIVEDLEKLVQQLSEKSISLKWSIEVMEVLKEMQKKLLAVLKNSELSISFRAEDDWFDQYMKETVTLLDFCNSLKYSLSRINRYCMMVDLIVLKLSEANISAALKNINELDFEVIDESMELFDTDAAFEKLRYLYRTFLSKNRSFSKSLATVLLAAETTMMVLSLLLVSALVHPISFDIGAQGLSSQVPELNQCLHILNELVGCFNAQKSMFDNCEGFLLAEHYKVAEIIEDLKVQIVSGDSEHVDDNEELLKRRSLELKDGIERLDAVINEVFADVMKGRNEMLQILREENLTG